MTHHLRRLALIGCLALLASLAPRAQMRVMPIDELQGHVGLGLALRHLSNTGIFMNATAHPDDEQNALLVMLNRGQGVRTVLATATRGNGGQNEIGPELFEALGLLRTEELAALHRFDGAEQYFTRAVDFGYSFSIEETFEKWGHQEILGDFVRLIRMVRPDVMLGMTPEGTGGGQHHQASAVLAREAYQRAGDPAAFPDQIKAGLRPWQPKKFYFQGRFGPPGAAPPEAGATFASVDLATYDPLLGKTYTEIGTEARSMHKCQGMAQLLALPGSSNGSYRLIETILPGEMGLDEHSVFDGVDTSVGGLARFAGSNPPAELTSGLTAIATAVNAALKSFDTQSDRSTLQPILEGLRVTRELRGRLKAMSIDDLAKFEIDFRLSQKEREFQDAALLANGLEIEALADDGVVVPGQTVKVSVIVANHGADVAVKGIGLAGFDGGMSCPPSTLKANAVTRCDGGLKIPADARTSEPYWHRAGEAGRYTFDADAPFGLPYRPTPFVADLALQFPGGIDIVESLPIQHRYEGNIFSGEKRMDLLVVPAFSVDVSPGIAIVPSESVRTSTNSAAAARELRVNVVNDSPDSAKAVVSLKLPDGWTATPSSQSIELEREDESEPLRFLVQPAANAAPGEYRVSALVSAGGRTFDRGFEIVEYPHTDRRHIYNPAKTTVQVIDVKMAPDLHVGYIMGVGDQVPPAIEQLGARLELITPDDLAFGTLSRFDTIVTGVRAYERRADLRSNNHRLLEYVRDGGTLIVQYNKFEFNQAQYGPYPAKVSSDRVTDENAPVTVLAADDPVLNAPNKIGDSAWKGWVQERGLYFLGEKDSRYRDLIRLSDPFPYNAGPKVGALVETTYGKGRWVYVGLGLWRQLPAGTSGAYQILANLISLGKRQ